MKYSVYAATLVVAASTALSHAATIDLAGDEADGYLAIVNFNQEGNTTLSAIESDSTDPKFFDYPAYVNPVNTQNIFIMSVEPYRFGLTYPDPLFPTSATTFAGVGELEQRLPGGAVPANATFVDAFSEDADFEDTDIGEIDFDESLLSGVGTETIGVADLTLNLDGTEFASQNNQPFGGDPGNPSEGRSNNNEFANAVLLSASNLTGNGLTFEDGVLKSIDLIADVSATAGPGAAPQFGFTVDGTLSFSGNRFQFDVDGLDSSPFAQNVRLVLNRSGRVSAVVPEPTSMALLTGLTTLAAIGHRRRR